MRVLLLTNLQLSGRQAERLRMFEAFQDFRIGYQRRNAFGSNVSVNDLVNQGWAKIIPPLVTCRSLGESRYKLFF